MLFTRRLHFSQMQNQKFNNSGFCSSFLCNLIKCFKERLRVLDYAAKVDAATFLRHDHFVPLWIRLISRFIRNYF